jgi:hypothetical protein
MAKRKPKENWRYVDMWAVPGVHPTNVDFLQRLKTADTQHFTKNMDVVGTISEKNEEKKWEKSHLIGIRSDIWKPDQKDVAETLDHLHDKRKNELRREIKRSGRLNAKQKQQLQDKVEEDKIMQMQCDDMEHRRLVLKTFRTTGKRVQWAGTIEQITTTETHNSLGSNRSLLTMAVMLPRHEYVTYIQQNHRTFRIPAIFSFCFFDEGRMWNVCLRRKWISAGADFEILIDGTKAGLINGLLFAMGSDSYVNLDAHPLTTCSQFLDLLALFSASVGYHKAMRRSVWRRVQACKTGDWHQHVIEDEELRLRHNGRSAA